ncbi:hypothetical protein ABPG72_000864 [Tetrahymena utriculariae]
MVGVSKKDLNKKKVDHSTKKGVKSNFKSNKDSKVKLMKKDENGKVKFQKPLNNISELKKEKVEKKKNLNEKKQKIKDAVDEQVEEFDNHGFFVVPTNMQISAEDEEILKQFSIGGNASSAFGDENLFDNIVNEIGQNISNKLEEKTQKEYAENMLKNPKVKIVYQDIAKLMSHYRSGKLARAFVIIPGLEQWEEVLELTKPSEWTPQALFTAVKLFSSSLDGHRAKVFFNKIIYPAVKADIKKNKKLNAHYYNALKKALYKPAAWFKGIIFPLITDPETTLKEAQIIASLLSKMTVPVMHSAACLLRLCSMPFNGPTCVMMKTIIEKKYALPNRVIDGLVDYLVKFVHEKKALPVLWHQMVLNFCGQYSGHFSELQKKALKQLVKKCNHHIISSEIIKAIDGENVIINPDNAMNME